MTFDPRDYVAVADHLAAEAAAGRGPPEAAFRVAIGRYYFAVLLAAPAVLRDSTPVPDEAERTHAWVIRSLRESSDPIAQQLVSELNRMRVSRNLAEYGDDLADVAAEVARAGRASRAALGRVTSLEKRFLRKT